MNTTPANVAWKDMLDEMQKDKEALTGKSKYWQPPSDKEGTFPIRILPPIKTIGEKKFYFQHHVHWIDRTAFECLNQTLVDKAGKEHVAEDCPACQMSKRLYRNAERDTDEWKLAGELSAKPRYVYRIIIRGKDDETLPEFYETGKTIFDMLYHIMTETEFGVIIDPKNGRDFNIVKKGVKRQARYEQSLPSATQTPIFKDTEKVRKVIDNAKKMAFNSLIEFSNFDQMDRAIKTYLGLSSGKSSTPKTTSAEPLSKYGPGGEDDLEQSSEPVETKVDSDIDSILAESGST
jgi:hypothetical protein